MDFIYGRVPRVDRCAINPGLDDGILSGFVGGVFSKRQVFQSSRARQEAERVDNYQRRPESK